MKKRLFSKANGNPPVIRERQVKLGAPGLETRINPSVTKQDLKDAIIRHCKTSSDWLAAMKAKK